MKMPEHQTLLWLPDVLADAGINFAQLHGWKDNQPGYYWTNEDNRHFGYNGDPVGWVWHHTATRGYYPIVKNANGQTKANLWMGLARGNRLYQSGGGLPTVVIGSGGPANYSEGTGKRSVLDLVAQDLQFHGPQKSPDDSPKFYGNRHYGTTETIHSGDGSPCHTGVWEMQIEVASLMCDHYGWSEYRHIGHLDHTKRKVDQKFSQGQPYTIGFMQGLITQTSPPPPPPEEEDMFPKRGDVSPTVKAYQYLLQAMGYAIDPAELFGSTMVNILRDMGFPGDEVGSAEYAAIHAGTSGDHVPHEPKSHTHPQTGETGSN